jgi:hypothetical protein
MVRHRARLEREIERADGEKVTFMERGKRITLKRGRKTRSFVVADDPSVTVGSEVRIRGEGGPPWTVLKIEDTEIIYRLAPASSAKSSTDPQTIKEKL